MTEPGEKRVLPRTWEELEEMARINRNVGRAPTRDDIWRLERKILKSWGRRRRKFYGP